MNKLGADPKVKKVFVRNCERKFKSSTKVVHDVNTNSVSCSLEKENQLGEPSLCSSEALANYLSDIKVSSVPPLSAEDLNIDKTGQNAKMTKKLNFHFNNRIYKNLVELNSNIENVRTKREKRPTITSLIKKDLEPNIEDFFENHREADVPPNISIAAPKWKPIRKVEGGQLHRLVASFEHL